MLEDLTPAEANRLINACIPAVVASLAARISDSKGDALQEVVAEQVERAASVGLSGVEFGLVKLQAAERVGVWLLNVMSALTGVKREDILLEMADTLTEEGFLGMFAEGDRG